MSTPNQPVTLMTPNQPTTPVPMDWPSFITAFNMLTGQVQALRSEVEELRANSGPAWITRGQAQALLCVKETKLWQLTTRDHIIETSGRLVSVASCKSYLASQAISQETIAARLTTLLRAKA